MILSKYIDFEGMGGQISCVIDRPAGEPRGWALVLHPHPLQGGTRDNKIVTTIARASVQHGLVALRPNFRGVGASSGTFDHGVGETEDMLMLIAQFVGLYPEIGEGKWLLGGFSFGTAVAAQVYVALVQDQLPLPDQVVLVGSAVQRFGVGAPVLPADTLLIHGDDDDVVPFAETLAYARTAGLPVTVVPGAGHFFHGRLGLLKQLVSHRLALL